MKKKIAIISIILLLMSGCTQKFTIKNEEGKVVKSYTSNIICQPEELKEIYDENKKQIKTDIDKLPKCSEFNFLKSPYEGLWTSIFVKPLAWLIIKIGDFVNSYGLSIMIVGLLLRFATLPITKKSASMNENMKKAKPELDKLEKKYKGKTDQNSTMMKSQEMMAIYKKYDISIMSGCLGAFLQLPIFFAFLEAVNRVPVFFEGKFLMFQLGTTPWEGIKAGNYWYILLIVLIIGATYVTFKNMSMNPSGDESQAKQMQLMNKFMIIFISLASFGLPTAIALYWIVSNGFTVVQNIIIKRKKDGGKEWKSTGTKVKSKKVS
jgi:YidC/Oxa1 family membrane protein insertase